MNSLATIANALLTIVFVVAVLAGWASRRLSREAKRSRRERAMVVAALRWVFRVETAAARHGWDAHPDWPVKPKELDPQFLDDDDQGAGSIADLAKALDDVRKGST